MPSPTPVEPSDSRLRKTCIRKFRSKPAGSGMAPTTASFTCHNRATSRTVSCMVRCSRGQKGKDRRGRTGTGHGGSPTLLLVERGVTYSLAFSPPHAHPLPRHGGGGGEARPMRALRPVWTDRRMRVLWRPRAEAFITKSHPGGSGTRPKVYARFGRIERARDSPLSCAVGVHQPHSPSPP